MGLIQTFRNWVSPASKAKGWTATEEGVLHTSWPSNWFQYGFSSPSVGQGPVIEACISAYAQTSAQLSIHLYRREDDGGKTLITSEGESRYANIARLLHRPNSLQTRSDFILNLAYQLYFHGNSYYYGTGMADRPDELWLLDAKQTTAHRVPGTSEVYYATGGPYTDWAVVEYDSLIPSRHIGHVRLHTPVDPLIGVTPIVAAAHSIAANKALTAHQAAFFTNMSRPSGFLSTDMELTKEQMIQLREAWDNQSTNLNSGGMPILASGMKYEQLGITSQDAQLVEAWRMSVEDISRVLRVPLPLINSTENTTLNNAETLMNFWLSSGLGFLLRHIEENLERFFGLDERYSIEFDTDRLLRSDFKGRMDALGTAVTKGIYSPDEARMKEGLSKVAGGHGEMPRVQQQMVPLDYEEEPAPAPAPVVEDEEMSPEDEEKTALMLARMDLEGLIDGTIH